MANNWQTDYYLCQLHVNILAALRLTVSARQSATFTLFIQNQKDMFALLILNTKWEQEGNKQQPLHFDHVQYLIFVKLCVPVNRSLDIRNSHFPPSLFLSSSLIGWAPSCPVGVGLSLLLPVFCFFFSWKWKLTKALKPCRRVFSHCW